MKRGKNIQIIILGDGAVGKTSMMSQYVDQSFQEDHITTLGLDFKTKKYTTKNGHSISVKLWDTAG